MLHFLKKKEKEEEKNTLNLASDAVPVYMFLTNKLNWSTFSVHLHLINH